MHLSARLQRGFTLIELATTAAVAGVTLTVAVPGGLHLLEDSVLSAEVNRFVAHFNFARSEAVKRGTEIVLCPSRAGADCERGSDWSDGFLIYADRDGDGARDEEDTILRHVHPDDGRARIRSRSASRWRVVFQPSGTTGGTNGSHAFCATHGSADARAVIVSNTGRVRVAERYSDGALPDCV
ncbi:MAG: GspH/FimT family pseudopilin [Chromatiales bacterium]|nr:GspH/FimT family pseudopilin [Chromatiales bacterium]